MRVEVRDHVLWVKHIDGAERTLAWLSAISAGETVCLVVDGVSGDWRKMNDGKDGRPTPGFSPIDDASKAHWHGLQDRRGTWVSLLAHASD